MSNPRQRGRRVPPPFAQIGRVNPTVEEMAQATGGQTGLFMLRFEHNPNCATILTQDWRDCSCGDDVDHRLLRFVDEGQAQ